MAITSRTSKFTQPTPIKMNIISFQGLMGGIGNTSIVAATAHALSQLKQKVLVLDLCPTNFLSYQFNLPITHINGWAYAIANKQSINGCCMQYTDNLDFIPFGQLEELNQLQAHLTEQKNFFTTLIHQIQALNIYQWLLLDLPHQTIVDDHDLQADLSIKTMMPNPNCHMRLMKYQPKANNKFLMTQYNPSHQLAHDLELLWMDTIEGFLPLSIHQDTNLSDAQALKMPVTLARPNCAASRDITALSYWLLNKRHS